MTMRWCLLLPTLLAACGGPAPAPETAFTPSPDGYIARVRALPPGQLRGVLFRSIRDGGQTCPQLTRFAAAPDVGGKPMWTATCADGGEWRIVLDDDGTALVTGASAR